MISFFLFVDSNRHFTRWLQKTLNLTDPSKWIQKCKSKVLYSESQNLKEILSLIETF